MTISPKSTHIPEFAGGIVAVTGTLTIDTGLRDVQSFSVTLGTTSVNTAASVGGVLQDAVAGQTRKILLQTWAADGATAGSTAADIAWTALGK